jgi:hypothetical protein
VKTETIETENQYVRFEILERPDGFFEVERIELVKINDPYIAEQDRWECRGTSGLLGTSDDVTNYLEDITPRPLEQWKRS